MITESRLIWLGIGVLVGYLLWGDKILHRSFDRETQGEYLSAPNQQTQPAGLPPVCGCGG